MAYTCSLTDENGCLKPPLTLAAMRGAAETVPLLLEKGHLAAVRAAVEDLGKEVALPLHAAAMVRSLGMDRHKPSLATRDTCLIDSSCAPADTRGVAH
jgi:hypothetical protein